MISAFEAQYFQGLATPREAVHEGLFRRSRVGSHEEQVVARMGWMWMWDFCEYRARCPICGCSLVHRGEPYSVRQICTELITDFLTHTRACPPRERADNIVLGSE